MNVIPELQYTECSACRRLVANARCKGTPTCEYHQCYGAIAMANSKRCSGKYSSQYLSTMIAAKYVHEE
jgi:hypothetical protein